MIKAINQTEQELLEGILQADRNRITVIYDQYLPGIIRFVRTNNGSESDARDIFQEAMIVLFRKVNSGSFQLACPLRTYILVVCRNLWRKRLRDKRELPLSEDEDQVDLGSDTVGWIERSDREQVYYKSFDALGEQCQQILHWFFDKVSMKEIAQRLETSESYVKKRKFICKERLVEAIKNDPAYEELVERG